MPLRHSALPRLAVALVCALALARAASADEPCNCPPPPEPDWKGGLGAGLSISSGNTSTKSYSLSFALAYDPKARNVVKADGLYLRQESDGLTTTDKTAVGVRDEYAFGGHGFVFGDVRYLRDPFKGVRYVISPVAGAGYKLIDQSRVTLALDGGLGGRFEGLEGQSGTTSGAAQAGESLSVKLSPSATLSQRATALFKLSDFGDALYRLEGALVVSVSKRFEMKLADYFDYKTRPPGTGLKKHDNAIVAAIVYKIG